MDEATTHNQATKAAPEQDTMTPQRRLRTQLAVIFGVRTILNTSHRIIYPFLPSIARGLDISLVAASGLVTVRLVAGLSALLFGPLVDRSSRRRTMEVAHGLYIAASLLLLVAGTLPTGQLGAAVVAFALYGLAKVLYDPAVYAYVSERVPYAQRGRAVGLIELSWSSAWLLGVPATGFLIERLGWQAPWTALVLFGGLGLWATRAFLPMGQPRQSQTDARVSPGLLLQTWRRLLGQRRVTALLSTSLLLSMGIELPFIVYGAWLESSYGLSLSALGLASIVVGLAEGFSEIGTALMTDRLGKRRSVLTGLGVMALSLLVLPNLAEKGLAGALAGVVLVTLGFEFAIVSLLPLATEVAPGDRASLLSLNVTAFGLGRIAGATGGALLWEWSRHSIATNAAAGAGCAVVAAVLLWRGLSEIEDSG